MTWPAVTLENLAVDAKGKRRRIARLNLTGQAGCVRVTIGLRRHGDDRTRRGRGRLMPLAGDERNADDRDECRARDDRRG
jgi:hypothetical protein